MNWRPLGEEGKVVVEVAPTLPHPARSMD